MQSLIDFEFIEFNHSSFEILRNALGISNEIYLKSITQYSLCEMASSGKSGSFFYKSMDTRFILKSVTESESDFLLTILDDYIAFMLRYPNTLLTRYLGLYSVRITEESDESNPSKSNSKATLKSMHFVVMENVLPNEQLIPMQLRFDLKGSRKDRFAKPHEKANPAKAIFKDIDFLNWGQLQLGPAKKEMMLAQLSADCEFLKSRRIMDYSLFLGVNTSGTTSANQKIAVGVGGRDRSVFRSDNLGIAAADNRNLPIANGPVYFLGIIDMLQPYNIKKTIEHHLKSIFDDPYEISCVDPDTYSSRFQSFVNQITV